MRKKWRNSVKNTKAYNTFDSVGSYHRIVSAKIRLSLRKSAETPERKQFDWKSLTTDSNLQERYTFEVHNRFDVFQHGQYEDKSATKKYERFIRANKEAAENIIPVKKRSHKARFSNDPRFIKARDNIK